MSLTDDGLDGSDEAYLVARGFENGFDHISSCCFSLGSGTVSYTHLDVYKRQVMVRQFSGNVLDGHIIKAAAVQHFSRGLSPGKIGHAAHFRIFVAVSYTHLDVYKRQPQER